MNTQKPLTLISSVVVLCMWMLASCLTINVYFPAAEVQNAADRFVEDVQSEDTAGQEKTPAEQTGSPNPKTSKTEGTLDQDAGRLTRWVASLLSMQFSLIGSAQAESNSIVNMDTPVARQLKQSMKGYQKKIGAFKDKGAVGENNRGLLAERNLQALSLKERAELNRLVATANGERMKLYLEIIRAKQYPEGKLEEVQRIFAKSWQSQSKAGWWIQQEGGIWVQK